MPQWRIADGTRVNFRRLNSVRLAHLPAALAVTLLAGSVTSLAAFSIPAGAAGATPSSTVITSSAPAGSTLGAPVTYTATVTPASGSGAGPTGTVSFTDNGTAIYGCTAVAVVTGSSPDATAQCATAASDMSAGSHPIVASYGGDSTYTNSSGNLTQTVSEATTSTVITSSVSSPSPYGVSVTFTATVTAGGGVPAFTPTRTVLFIDGSSLMCPQAQLSAVTAGVAQATCTEPFFMTVGTHAVSATYSGNPNFSSSTVVTPSLFTVTPASTSTAVSAAYGGVDGPVFSIAVTPEFSGAPTGTVTVLTGSTTLCTVTLPTTTCTTGQALPARGSYPLFAVYSGDADFTGSTGSDPVGSIVTPTATTTVVTVEPSTVAYGAERWPPCPPHR